MVMIHTVALFIMKLNSSINTDLIRNRIASGDIAIMKRMRNTTARMLAVMVLMFCMVTSTLRLSFH